MAIGWEPSTVCCRNGIPFGAAYISKYTFTLGFKNGSLLTFKGYVNEIPLLILFMFSEPGKSIFVNKLSTSVLVYVFRINDDNSSSTASISFLL